MMEGMPVRPVVSYEDITLPYDQPDELQAQPSSSSRDPYNHLPSKKRKKNNQKAKQHRSASNSTTQRAEFIKSTGASYKQQPEEEQCDPDPDEGEYDYDEGGEGEESRELTYEEIWDDSTLVNAWEAATEEYEAFHGADKGWKKEPVNKSPLWYNVPVNLSTKAENTSPPSSTKISSGTAAVHDDDAEPDSQPLNFDTFVPTHDPSLDIPSDPTSNQIPVPDTDYIPGGDSSAIVSQDEAFSRALSAMYWGGYWTAIYHAQRQLAVESTGSIAASRPEVTSGAVVKEEEEDEDLEEIESDNEEFTSTQR